MFVGRENEMQRLDGLWKKSVSSLVTIFDRCKIKLTHIGIMDKCVNFYLHIKGVAYV